MELSNIEKYVSDCLEENGWEDYFLVELVISDSRKIQIYMDSDNHVDYAKCRQISRFVEERLDATLEYGDDYTLEVSSAGVGRPLKFFRQYKKNIGRNVSIKTLDGEKIKGILEKVTDDHLSINQETTVKKGKKKSKTYKEIILDMNNIKETKIAISF